MARFAFMVAAREWYRTLGIARGVRKKREIRIQATKGHEMKIKIERNERK